MSITANAMAPIKSNFIFCPTCYDEGSRFLNVTDTQRENLHKFYKDELKKKDELIYLLHKNMDAQKQGHKEAMEKQSLEYESKLCKREDIITSIQNAKQQVDKFEPEQEKELQADKLVSQYLYNAREGQKQMAAKGKSDNEYNAGSVLKEVGNLAATPKGAKVFIIANDMNWLDWIVHL